MLGTASLIFFFSSQTGQVSGRLSGSIADSLLNALSPAYKKMPRVEQMSVQEAVHAALRKAAHFAIFAALGFFIYALLFFYGLSKNRRLRLSLLLGFLYCVSDELHQIFVPGRNASAIDALLDFSGVVSGVAACLACVGLYLKRQKK